MLTVFQDCVTVDVEYSKSQLPIPLKLEFSYLRTIEPVNFFSKTC